MIIKRIGPIKLSLLIGLFEAFALFGLYFFRFDSGFIHVIFLGLVDGIIASLPSLLIFNLFFTIKINEKKVKKIHLGRFTLANSIFLSLLFVLEKIVNRNIWVNQFTEVLIFIPVFYTVTITLIFLYNMLAKKISFGWIFSIDDRNYGIQKISYMTAATITFYEVCILLFMVPLLSLSFINSGIEYGMVGFLSGFFGSLCASLLYNKLFKTIFPATLDLK